MKFLIHGRVFKNESSQSIQEIFNEIEAHHIEYSVSESFAEILIENQIQFKQSRIFNLSSEISDYDMALSLGGDGSFLETLWLVAKYEIPVLGINFGRLGFLTDIQPQHIKETIDKILQKDYSIDERIMINARADTEIFESGMNFALNEIAIAKTDTSSMIVINTYVDGEFLNSYWADGIMVATPTGSTGYNLSCGGPLMVPQSDNFVITPICPHNLFVRPIIVSSKSQITFSVESRSKNFLLSMDSRAKIVGDEIGEIVISLEKFKAKLVKIKGNDFLSTLRKKLRWGEDIRNRV
ncbi:MAG: NAD kinase [Cytophagaceae bacterium]|nr:NAD kinase [Cytophagaceae bacterium]MBK9934492.1 NAD kinase [Cytophagaceae bacterium]MBL0300938.1 NAD kinase [Cytophagaceae bacterium]MBL0323751.1 NAD kinase [Cytophagaceae bacterium]